MKVTEFMISDICKKYKLTKFKSVVLQKYEHEGHKSFLYVEFVDEEGVEFHLTTDNAYPPYETKRLTTPSIVYIFDTYHAIRDACELLNFLI